MATIAARHYTDNPTFRENQQAFARMQQPIDEARQAALQGGGRRLVRNRRRVANFQPVNVSLC